jgi:hypothetical protein
MAPRIREPSQRTDGFSQRALSTFKQMLKLDAECECSDGNCIACREWWDKHRILMRELELPPWCFPCVERLGSTENYEAEARWRRLERAVRKAAPVERVRLTPRPEPEMAATPADPETVTLDRD